MSSKASANYLLIRTIILGFLIVLVMNVIRSNPDLLALYQL